jgi:arsenate reductase (thioredoxin)
MRAKPANDPLIHIEQSIDQRQALKSATARLHSEFADTFDLGTIERLLHSSYDQLAASATVHDFLALLAERFARQRIRGLAKV